MTTLRRFSAASAIASALLAAAAGGYYGGALHHAPFDSVGVGELPSVEYLEGSSSFSEIDNVRGELDALGQRILMEVRLRTGVYGLWETHSQAARGEPWNASKALEWLERASTEFEGLDHQQRLIDERLLLLQKQHDFPRWLDLYLHTLYQHPTRPSLGVLAARALRFAEATGRRAEILAAFRHVASIPLDFPARQRYEDVLAGRDSALADLATRLETPFGETSHP